MRRRGILAGVVALFVAGLLVSCSEPNPASHPAAKQTDARVTFRRGIGAEPDSLDPQKAWLTSESVILYDLFEGLMAVDAKGNIIYGAAESSTTSADGLTWTFKLRDEVWSDGVPVTAEDFVYSFQRLMNPKTASQTAVELFAIKNAQAINQGKLPPEALGVRAIDAKTFEITLEQPTPFLPAILSTPFAAEPVPKHLVEKYGDDWVKPGVMVNNGAYMLAEWVPNSYVHAVKNPRYYDADKVQIESVYYMPISDAAIELARYKTGDLDMTENLPARELDAIKAAFGSQVHVHARSSTAYLSININKAPFNDDRVREALSLAVDRDLIAGQLLKAGQIPAYEFIPPGMNNYPGGAVLSFRSLTIDQRRAKATELLKQAGFDSTHPLRFTYRYIENIDSRRIAITLQGMWKAIGIDVKLLNSEGRVHYNSLRQLDFDVAQDNWGADYNDVHSFLMQLESTSGELNYSQYKNPAYDALAEQSAHTLDAAARAVLVRQAEQTLIDDDPIIPLYHDAYRRLVRPYIKGYEDNVFDTHRTRYLSIDRAAGPQS